MADTIAVLQALAEHLMLLRGLEPHFPVDALNQLSQIHDPAPCPENCTDLRSLVWCSIDNDSSRDLDQLTYAEFTEDKKTIWIAIADVDALVRKGTPLDKHAQKNTTSVYTPTKIFSMLPEHLSTDLTSLNEGEDRLAVVVKITFTPSGESVGSTIFQALVHNYAKLTYCAVGEWLEGSGKLPEKVKHVSGLEKSLKCQHELAQILRNQRSLKGALALEMPQLEPELNENQEIVLKIAEHNLAHQLIEEFMIASNSEMARTFAEAQIPSLSRVVRIPKRWDRIVEIASQLGERLPTQPDPRALNAFLIKRRQADPVAYPDLSLAIIKLLGRGEYIVNDPKAKPIGHFGLALQRYAHSTAPNRRFPDLIAQRQYKALLHHEKNPYSLEELHSLAQHCTAQEDAANKVERQINKSAAAIVLSSQIGTIFKGIVTGSDTKGTWVRIFQPSVEGRVIKGFEPVDVGDRVSVKLVSVDVPKGYIDFVILAIKSSIN